MLKIKEIYLILFLIAISFLVRALIAPLYIMFPYIPHDFSAYIGGGKCMAEGKYFMWDCTDFAKRTTSRSLYGPLYLTLSMGWYLIFGTDFFLFKMLSTVFDVANIVLIFFIGKKFFNKEMSFYLALVYSFSFLPLWTSSVLGNNSPVFMSFLLLSIYFLMKKRLILSSFFSIVSILFKIIPAMAFPVIIYYIFRKYGRKKTMMYIFSSILFFVLLIIPFIMIAGLDKTFYSFTATLSYDYSGSGTMSIYNIFKYVSNIDIDFLSKGVLIAGYLVTFYLIIKHPLKDYEKELQRNILLVFICSVLLGIWITSYYMYFLFLFIFFLFGNYIKNFKRMKKQWLFGVSLTIISLILFSAIYRWSFVNYTWFDRVLLLVAIVLAPIGTFYSLNWLKKSYRNVWVLLVFAIIMFDELHAAPLVILPMEKIADKLIDTSKMKVVMELYGDHIDSKSKFLAYGIFYGLPALMVWIGLIYYYYVLLTEKYEKQENIT